MPWCEACAKFWNPNSMTGTGRCPDCDALIGAKKSALDDPVVVTDGDMERAASPVPDGMGPDLIDTSIPWHFWVMVAALGLYLGWRLLQGIAWVLDSV